MPPKGNSAASTASSPKGSSRSRNPTAATSLTTSRASSAAPVPSTGASVQVGPGENERVPVRSSIITTARVESDDVPEVNFEDSQLGSSRRRTPLTKFQLQSQLQRNKLNMDKAIDDKKWVLEPTEKAKLGRVTRSKDPILHIISPTASGIGYEMLNPYIYESVKPLKSLAAFAKHLGVDADWETIYDEIIDQHKTLPQSFNLFCALPEDTSEAVIEIQLSGIVRDISTALETVTNLSNQTRVIVGGILSRPEYNLFSRTDFNAATPDSNMWYLATEAKTAQTFQPGKPWYLSCRAVQVLTAMYSFNCPTFLYTQQQWKVFVEDGARRNVYTSVFNPVNNDTNPIRHQASKMDDSFLKAITICLLSPRIKSAVQKQQIGQAVTVGESSRATSSGAASAKTQPGKRSKSQDKKGKGKRKRDDEEENDEEAPVPTVVVGFSTNGEEIRVPIRIYSREEAQRIDVLNKQIEAQKRQAQMAEQMEAENVEQIEDENVEQMEDESEKNQPAPKRPLLMQQNGTTLVPESERSSE